MTRKPAYIWMLFVVVLFSLFCFQGVWLYNAYSMAKAEMEGRVDDLLLTSMMSELDIRYVLSIEKNKNTPPDSIEVFNYELNSEALDDGGLVSQQMEAIQKLMVFDGFPFDLLTLDSLYGSSLAREGIRTKYRLQCCDTATGMIRFAGNEGVSGSAFRTNVYPIVDGMTVQAMVEIPISALLKRNMVIFTISLLLLLLLAGCFISIVRLAITQRALLRLRDDITNTLTHNMRTPLNSLLLVLHSKVKNKPDDESAENPDEMVQLGMRQVETLYAMIDMMLAVSCSENKKLVLDKQELSIVDLLDKVTEKYQLSVRRKKITITKTYEVDGFVYANETHLSGAIDNLVGNAVKYSGNQVDIHIHCYTEQDRLFIRVKDTGFGIPEKALQQIFERYKRYEDETRKGKNGLGLGLYYVKLIAEAHGGDVSVASTEKVGSEFVISIPVHTD